MTTTMTTTTTMHVFAGVPIVAKAVIDTPLGPMTALATDKGLAALLFDADKYHQGPFESPAAKTAPRHPHLAAARCWLDAYWRGEDPSLDGLTFDLHGSAFQRAVWRVLLTIPFGRTRTYGEVAAQVGHGAMPRATGSAVGRNPVAVIVPCHRVIGANGSLTGYASGLPLKERLLQHEGVLLA
jgi:methylated-DNA-[protein]-cysteine S-methyltransferase